jgi:hypothetical protein
MRRPPKPQVLNLRPVRRRAARRFNRFQILLRDRIQAIQVVEGLLVEVIPVVGGRRILVGHRFNPFQILHRVRIREIRVVEGRRVAGDLRRSSPFRTHRSHIHSRGHLIMGVRRNGAVRRRDLRFMDGVRMTVRGCITTICETWLTST